MRCLVGLLAVCLAGCSGGSPATTRSPSGSPSLAATDVGALLARRLALPSLASGQPCPVTPARTHSPVTQPATARGPGRGPLYPITFYLGEDATLHLKGRPAGSDGLYESKVVWASAPGGYQGPVVVRVGRIDGPGRGQVRIYADPAASRGAAVVFTVDDTPSDWPSGTWVTGPGCYAYQLDGRTFTEVIVFRVAA